MWVRNGLALAPPWICCRIGCLDFQKPLADQCFADRVQDGAACPDQIAGLGVDRQVDVAGAYPRFLVGQSLPLVGQWTQAFSDQPPTEHHQGAGALLAVTIVPDTWIRSPRSMAPVKSACRARVEHRIIKQQLDFAGPVAQLGEQYATVVANAQHTAGPRSPCRRPRNRRPARWCGSVPRRRDRRRPRLTASDLSLAIRTRTCSGSRGPSSAAGRSASRSPRSGALPSWCNKPVATRFSGAEM
jgi:hypothetical protein